MPGDTAEGSVSQRHCPRTPLSSVVQVRSGLSPGGGWIRTSGTADDARLLADLYAHNASRQMPQKGSSDQTVACFRRLGAGVVGSDYDEFRSSGDESGSHATRRWREQDSTSRSRRERNGRWEARHISFRAQLYELGARQSRERPKSSNPSPPGGSPVRTFVFGPKTMNIRRANRVANARPSRSLGARRGHRSLS